MFIGRLVVDEVGVWETTPLPLVVEAEADGVSEVVLG